jgi:hypothetical protein
MRVFMKKILVILVGIFMLFSACTKEVGPSTPKVLSISGTEATGPYFTKDNKGNAVLCWTEKDSDASYRLKYAVYNTQTDQFDQVITVPASAGCSTAAESMGKVAFKADGTVLAVFAKRFPNEKNPYAGAIYYSFSDDGGKHWSEARFLHADTARAHGRSFFDITTLKDGELGAIWLDGRYGKSIKGSALFFARTEKGMGFAQDTCLDKGTCECCRTDILTDDAGNIHLAYRNIEFPSALADQEVRDMAYKRSADNGKTFSTAETISKDNWEITGCPHSGPSLAAAKNGVHAVWFTAGGGPGLYCTSSNASGEGFLSRSLLSAAGRHPQMIALNDGRLAVVYEEPLKVEARPAVKVSHNHGEMKMGHVAAGSAKIVLRILNANNLEKSIDVTDGKMPDNHAVLTAVNHTLLTAWVREEKNGARIYYSGIR